MIKDLKLLLADHGAVVRVSMIGVDGSSPRNVGAFMNVTCETFTGTIGGGALENEALAVARRMLDQAPVPWRRRVEDYPLGPDLGQCCGGHVRLLYEIIGGRELGALEAALAALPEAGDMAVARPLVSGSPMLVVSGRKNFSDDFYVEPLGAGLTPLYLYGAGHVGRAVVHVLAGLPFEIHWVDTGPDRFPGQIPEGVLGVVAENPADVPAMARSGAYHVVMTFSHGIDFDVCRAVLAAGNFAYLGLIGSKTKRARFALRLRDAGLNDDWIDRLHCPIGVPRLEGKEPAVIAVSLAADLLLRLSQSARATAGNTVMTGGEA